MLSNLGTVSPLSATEDGVNGRLLRFIKPKKRRIYVLGVDVGSGRGLSNSVIHVLQAGNTVEPDMQAAEWACNFVDPVQLAAVVDLVSRYYWDFEFDQPALTVVENNNFGHVTLTTLNKDFQHPNLFQQERFDSARNSYSMQLGYQTNERSRADMIMLGEHRIKTGQWIINSPFFLREMEEFELVKLKNTRALDQELLAAAGRFEGRSKDDRLMAGFIANFALDNTRPNPGPERERQAERTERKVELPDWRSMPVSYEQMMEEWEEKIGLG